MAAKEAEGIVFFETENFESYATRITGGRAETKKSKLSALAPVFVSKRDTVSRTKAVQRTVGAGAPAPATNSVNPMFEKRALEAERRLAVLDETVSILMAGEYRGFPQANEVKMNGPSSMSAISDICDKLCKEKDHKRREKEGWPGEHWIREAEKRLKRWESKSLKSSDLDFLRKEILPLVRHPNKEGRALVAILDETAGVLDW